MARIDDTFMGRTFHMEKLSGGWYRSTCYGCGSIFTCSDEWLDQREREKHECEYKRMVGFSTFLEIIRNHGEE